MPVFTWSGKIQNISFKCVFHPPISEKKKKLYLEIARVLQPAGFKPIAIATGSQHWSVLHFSHILTVVLRVTCCPFNFIRIQSSSDCNEETCSRATADKSASCSAAIEISLWQRINKRRWDGGGDTEPCWGPSAPDHWGVTDRLALISSTFSLGGRPPSGTPLWGRGLARENFSAPSDWQCLTVNCAQQKEFSWPIWSRCSCTTPAWWKLSSVSGLIF